MLEINLQGEQNLLKRHFKNIFKVNEIYFQGEQIQKRPFFGLKSGTA